MCLKLLTRVARKVVLPEVDGDCWEWDGAHIPQGYASLGFRCSGKSSQVGAHRVLYEMFVGKIPDGLQLDHLCRNRGCVNPDHLEAVTSRENHRRSDSISGINMRKTECVNGHAFSEENTRIKRNRDGSVERVCRACARDVMNRLYALNPSKFIERARKQREKKRGK